MSWGDKGEEYRPDKCDHPTDDRCMWCCETCNHDMHRCPGCGTVSDHKNTVCPECEVEYANNCPACPDGCNSCTRDRQCECYEHDWPDDQS